MTDYIEHDMDIRDSIKVRIRRDDWIASKPWFADVEFPDGTVWRGWQEFFRTKKALIEAIKAAAPSAEIIRAD